MLNQHNKTNTVALKGRVFTKSFIKTIMKRYTKLMRDIIRRDETEISLCEKNTQYERQKSFWFYGKCNIKDPIPQHEMYWVYGAHSYL